jgi:Mn2+/Fe2+ NRAMP family transporter
MTNKTLMMPAAGVEAEVMPLRGRVVKSKWTRDLLTFLMVFGPGLIVMVADNDAGAVSTYSQAGAQYGTHLLWIVLLLLPVCYFIQEMVVRLGIATGKGHAAMIYQRFGKWWGLFSLVDLQLVNFLTLVTEFAAINLALSKMGVDPRYGVPLAAAGLILLVLTGSYRRWERIVVFLCLLDFAWFWIAFRLGPPLGQIVKHALLPSMPAGGITPELMFLVIAIVGTTIAPWQLFFPAKLHRRQAAALCRPEVGASGHVPGRLRYGHRRRVHDDRRCGLADAWLPLHRSGANGRRYRHLRGAGDAQPDPADDDQRGGAGHHGDLAFERLGLRRSPGLAAQPAVALARARGFYSLYLICVAAAAGIVLIPRAPLQLIILGVQVLAGVILPSAIIFLQLLLNDKELLGEYANKPWNNWVNWTIIIVLFILSLILAAQVAAPNLFPSAAGGPTT